MRITNLTAYQPPTPDAPPDWRTQLGQIVVRVETDGEFCGVGVGGGGAAGIHLVETVFRDLLLDREVEPVEALHAEMCRHTTFYGRSGLVVMALSGVDLALWDLRGKAQNRHVAHCLNPDVDLSQPLPMYSTVFDDVATERAVDAGFGAVKLHVERFGDRPDPSVIADLVARVRESLGPDRPLMIDAFARWNVRTTLEVAEAIAGYQVDWLEEPLPPDDLTGYAQLVRHSPVPIAGGEHEYLAGGFRPLIEGGLHSVLQPDINWCGGMTTLVEIYRMAAAANVRVCPHRGGEPFALAALVALDPAPLAESPRTWFDHYQPATRIAHGKVFPSAGVGFGVAIG